MIIVYKIDIYQLAESQSGNDDSVFISMVHNRMF